MDVGGIVWAPGGGGRVGLDSLSHPQGNDNGFLAEVEIYHEAFLTHRS